MRVADCSDDEHMGTRGCRGVRGEAACRPSEARVRNAAPASGGSHVFHIPRWRASPVWRASPEVSGSAPFGCARITHFDLGVVVRPPTSAFRRAAGEVGCCKAPPGERTTHLGLAVATCHPLQTCGGILSAHIVTFAREACGGFLSLRGKPVAGASRQPKASLLPDRDGPSGLPLVVKGFKMVRARVYMRRGMGTQRTRVPHTPLRQGWPGRFSGKARGTGVPDPKEVPHGRRSWSQSIMQFPRGGACSRLCRVASELASPSACAP